MSALKPTPLIQPNVVTKNGTTSAAKSKERASVSKNHIYIHIHQKGIEIWTEKMREKERESEKKKLCDSELITGHVNVILIFDCNNWDLSVNAYRNVKHH